MLTIEQIREALQDRNLSVVAAATGIGYASLVRLANGQSEPAYSTVCAVAELLADAGSYHSSHGGRVINVSHQIEADAPFSDYQTTAGELCEVPRGSKGPMRKLEHQPRTAKSPSAATPVCCTRCRAPARLTSTACPRPSNGWPRRVSTSRRWRRSRCGADHQWSRSSGKLLYRTFLPLPSKKIVVEGKTILEFRCASSSGDSRSRPVARIVASQRFGLSLGWRR